MTDLCTVCDMPVYEGCRNADGCGGNVLVIQEDRTVVQTCPNMKRLRLRRYLESIDPQLVKPGLRHDRYSPLYQPAKEGKSKIDLTLQNLLIRKIAWNAFLPHLKWIAACKGTGWFCRVVTDRTLLNIFVGNTSVKVRRLQSDSDGLLEANSIEDHLKDPDLVIIRMGCIVHYNKAAANVLSETLRMRASLDKPTWLIEPEDQEFSPYSRNDFGMSIGMVICTEATKDFVNEHFRKVKIKTTVPVQALSKGYQEDDDGNVTLGDEEASDEGNAYEGLPEVEEVAEPEESAEDGLEEGPEVDTSGPDLSSLWQESSASKKKRFRR